MDIIKIMPVFVLLLAAGCMQAEETPPNAPQEAPEEPESPQAPPEDGGTAEDGGDGTAEPAAPEEGELQVDFIFSKDTYAVGEKFDGEINVTYSGEPFEGIIASTLVREGFAKSPSGYSQEMIDAKGSSMNLMAYDIHENGFRVSKNFTYAGAYTYTVKVYDCADVAAEFGICHLSDLDMDDVVETVTPIGVFSKSFQVVED